MHADIRQRICLLDFPPGAQLSETALAEEFGTSRTPVRRVLARLEEEGLVQSVHGVGTLVTDADITGDAGHGLHAAFATPDRPCV